MRTKRFAEFSVFTRPLIGCLAFVLTLSLLALNVPQTVTANSRREIQDSPARTVPSIASGIEAVPDINGADATSPIVSRGAVNPAAHTLDFNGDVFTDGVVVRNTGGGPSGQATWYIINQHNPPVVTAIAWGLINDTFVPEDYDGDGKTDAAVWRPGAPFNSYFYILQSLTGTLRTEVFGQTGDDPTVVGDYDGDGKSDPAVYRAGASPGDQSFWYYRSSLNGSIVGTAWGQNGDFPGPGDYDGDLKNDFVVQRNNGGGQARFFLKQSTAGESSVVFGTPTDVIVPGDYDGDGKTDIATARGIGGVINWFVRRSSDLVVTQTPFGASATDFTTQGDGDGDGKTDYSVWRPNANPGMSFFFVRGSLTGLDFSFAWGQNGDYPVLNYNSH